MGVARDLHRRCIFILLLSLDGLKRSLFLDGFKNMYSGRPGKATRWFTSKELRKLNQPSNGHVAYRGKVYDVSSFLSKHPGGVQQIMSGLGNDITQVFDSYHKRQTFERVLSKYYVGELRDNEYPIFVNQSKFYDVVRERVQRYMDENNLDPKIDFGAFFYYCAVVVLYFASMYTSIAIHYNHFVCIMSAVLWGILTFQMFTVMLHDGSHFAVTHKPWIWKCVMIIGAITTGRSSYTWHYQHIFGHHIYTNVDGFDPDLNTDKTKKEFWRVSHLQVWARRFMYQHIYVPFIFNIVMTRMKIQDLKSIFTLKKDCFFLNPITRYVWLEFWGTKVAHVVLKYIIPFYFLPLGYMILVTLISEIVYSFTFGQITVMNHVTENALMTKADDHQRIHMDWAELQVASTQDYCTNSWLWTVCSGSLNHQTAHHLFPGFLPAHYRWITPIIKETCAEFGVKYNCQDSFIETLQLHYGHLLKMGRGDDLATKKS